jgi:sortase A
MIGKTFYQPVTGEVRYYFDKVVNRQYVVAETSPEKAVQQQKVIEEENVPRNGLSSLLNIKPVEIIKPVDPEFGIIIPKINANATVVQNVNSANEEQYLSALKKGVAHAEGTAFPGEGGHIFLFAHSTDYFWNVGTYNAIFYLLYKVQKEDEIDMFYKNQRYVYKVIDTQIVDPTQVEFLTRKSNKEFLTLQTCWPPGTTLKRLLVFAVRVIE